LQIYPLVNRKPADALSPSAAVTLAADAANAWALVFLNLLAYAGTLLGLAI
jgi:hypothetical protein